MLCTFIHSFIHYYSSSSSMANLTFYVGILGNLISIMVFLAPISTFRRIIKKRDVEEFKGLPYICTLLCASLWCFYAFLKPNSLLIMSVNAIGVVFQVIYITIFIIFAPKTSKIKHLVVVGVMNVGFLGLVIAVVLLAIHGVYQITIVGVLCAGFTLGMYGAPLAAMKNVIETRSVEFMPFNLSFFLFMNGAIWSCYALLTKDYYVGIPNGIGCILGAAQLILYMAYRNSKPIKSMDEDEKAGSAHLVKGTFEMGSYKPERVLSKGRSLPVAMSLSLTRQPSFQKLGKTYSWTNVDLEKGISTTTTEHALQLG